MYLSEILAILGIFVPPISVTAWFWVSLIKFLRTDKQDTELKKKRKTMLIISSVVFGIMTAAIIALSVLFALAIKHM